MTSAATVSRRARERRQRERDIVEATRALFDERGVQDAPVDDIARAVGLNKAIIYRHFSSKEELFILAVTHYLDDLAARLDEVDASLEPVARLRALSEQFTAFCLEYPAFIDCALSLMRRSAEDLRETVSDSIWLTVGRAMADCLRHSSRTLADGAQQGVFQVDDPDLMANRLYTQTLGTMHLALLGIGVKETDGRPDAFAIEPQEIRWGCIEATLAYATAPKAAGA
jgi:AcrR family transcriptional regulator